MSMKDPNQKLTFGGLLGKKCFFTKFSGKHLNLSLSFNKVAGLRSATSLKEDSGTGVFL